MQYTVYETSVTEIHVHDQHNIKCITIIDQHTDNETQILHAVCAGHAQAHC